MTISARSLGQSFSASTPPREREHCARKGQREELMFVRVRDSHSRPIVKAVSWRDTGSVDTFVLSFVFTGSIKVAGSIAGAEAITKMILYSSRKGLVLQALGPARTSR